MKLPTLSLRAKWVLWSLFHAFFAGGAAAVGMGVVAPHDIGTQYVKLFQAMVVLGVYGVWQWIAAQKNPYEPDTVSLKHLPDDAKLVVRGLLVNAGLDSKGQPEK